MRRHLWLAVVVFVLIIAATAVALAAHKPSVTAAPARVAARHQACPMHPEVTSVSREKCSELSASCGSCGPTGR